MEGIKLHALQHLSVATHQGIGIDLNNKFAVCRLFNIFGHLHESLVQGDVLGDGMGHDPNDFIAGLRAAVAAAAGEGHDQSAG